MNWQHSNPSTLTESDVACGTCRFFPGIFPPSGMVCDGPHGACLVPTLIPLEGGKNSNRQGLASGAVCAFLGFWGISGLAYPFILGDEWLEPCYVVPPHAQAMEPVYFGVNHPKPWADSHLFALYQLFWRLVTVAWGWGGAPTHNSVNLSHRVRAPSQRTPQYI